jgi:hypothetical protein
MKIENLADLKKLLKACQDFGVHNIEVDGIKMQLNAVDASQASDAKSAPEAPQAYSDEDLLMWSSAHPEYEG